MPIDWSKLRDDELCNVCISVRGFLLKSDGELLEICRKFLRMVHEECKRRNPLFSQVIRAITKRVADEVPV